MTTRILTVVLRTALLVALMTSAAMFVDYRNVDAPAFCGVQSGCAAVRDSAFSKVGGIPVPDIGLGVFAGIFATAVWASRERHLKFLLAQCLVAGLGALTLIGLMVFKIGAICQWCMAVDSSSIIAAVAAIALSRRRAEHESTSQRLMWASAGVLAVAVPMLWQQAPAKADVPDGVARHQQRGKVNIIMFTDFQCPFCRVFHSVVDEVVSSEPERFNVVRLMRPLASHPGAEPAALAYLCTPDAQREDMAKLLYGGTPGELNPPTIKLMAASVGVDGPSYDRCLEDPATRGRLEEESRLFKEAQLRGLPSTFVEDELVLGADVKAFEAAVAHALEGQQEGLPVRYMVLLLAGVFAAAGAWSLRDGMRAARA